MHIYLIFPDIDNAYTLRSHQGKKSSQFAQETIIYTYNVCEYKMLDMRCIREYSNASSNPITTIILRI